MRKRKIECKIFIDEDELFVYFPKYKKVIFFMEWKKSLARMEEKAQKMKGGDKSE